jgi:hypothetical protein
MQTTPTVTSPRSINIGLLLIAIVYIGLTLPAFFGYAHAGRDSDEANFHLPTIRQITKNWPRLDLKAASYSAVSPGYHYLLATFAVGFGDDRTTLRAINWIVSAALPFILYCFIRQRLPRLTASLVLLPLVASNFFVKSACWVLPDNAALLAVILTLVVLFESRSPCQISWKIGILAAIATAFRQLNIWLTAPIAANSIRQFVTDQQAGNRRAKHGRWMELGVAIGSTAPSLIVLGVLLYAWNGVVPPSWRDTNQSPAFSMAFAAVILSLFGLFGAAYIPLCVRWKSWSRADGWLIATSASLGLLISVVSPTSYDADAGRWSGYLWLVVQQLPHWHGRSIFFCVFAPAGAAVLAALWRAVASDSEWHGFLWAVACITWISVFIATRQLFQRYYEPTIIVFLAIAASYAECRVCVARTWMWYVPLLCLTLAQIAIVYVTIYM